MIDLHIHILPGLDDGPPDVEAAVELAEAVVRAEVNEVVATPHIRDDYPFSLDDLAASAAKLRSELIERAVPLAIFEAGEVALSTAADLDDRELGRLTYGRGRYLLVESPYSEATDYLERSLFDLQSRGFSPVLAHPERSPSLQQDVARMATLVERGILASITAASMAGQFGSTVQEAATEMLVQGLVHDVASDAHDVGRRRPGLREGFAALDASIEGLADAEVWFTTVAPGLILAGKEVPGPPRLERRRAFRRRRRRTGRPT